MVNVKQLTISTRSSWKLSQQDVQSHVTQHLTRPSSSTLCTISLDCRTTDLRLTDEQLTNDWSGRNWREDIWRKTDEGRADEWLTWAQNWRTLTWAKLLCRNASIVVGKVRNPTKGLPDCLSPYRLFNNRQSRPLANRLVLADSRWQLYKDRMFYCHLRWVSRCGAFWAFVIPPWWPPSNNGRGMGLHLLCYASSACRFYYPPLILILLGLFCCSGSCLVSIFCVRVWRWKFLPRIAAMMMRTRLWYASVFLCFILIVTYWSNSEKEISGFGTRRGELEFLVCNFRTT